VNLPPEILTVLTHFAPLFNQRIWPKAPLLAIGALLATGRRTVASALQIMGHGNNRHFTNFHRLLNRDEWSSLQAGRIVLLLILTLLPVVSPLGLAVDDTIERRNGRKIRAKGCYRDTVRSSQKQVVRCYGLKWVVLAVLVPMPWRNRCWALPVPAALAKPARKAERRNHKSSIDWARQLAPQERRWAPGRRVVLVTDGGFASVALAGACRPHDITLICRTKLNAAFHDSPIEPPPGRRGRKPTKVLREPSPRQQAADPQAPWAEVMVAWYGSREQVMRELTGMGLWTAPRVKPLPLNYLVTRDPSGTHRDAAYFCTDGTVPPDELLGYVVARWGLEVTFAEMRGHLGMETQRQWSDLATTRTTPVLLGLFSVVSVLAVRWHGLGELKVSDSACYVKAEPTFADCLALTRLKIWQNRIKPDPAAPGDPLKLPEPLWNAVIEALSRAAYGQSPNKDTNFYYRSVVPKVAREIRTILARPRSRRGPSPDRNELEDRPPIGRCPNSRSPEHVRPSRLRTASRA